MSFFNWPTIGHKSRAGRVDNYPFDLDASERVVRPKTGIDIFPMPNNAVNFAQLGQVSGLMPQVDYMVWGQMWGRDPYGPIMGTLDAALVSRNALPVNLQWQTTIPGLNKQMPNTTAGGV